MPKVVRQISAGGIVYRKHAGLLQVALISIRRGKVWCLPKGGVEDGESIKEAARREVREETGLAGGLVQSLGSLTYWFSNKSREGELVRIFKRVYFFLFRYRSGRTEDHDDEVDEVVWLPIRDALEKLVYPGEREIMKKAMVALSLGRKQKTKTHTTEGHADL
jgi:bis(5'-nucleosidyl)-tetraphosphatase